MIVLGPRARVLCFAFATLLLVPMEVCLSPTLLGPRAAFAHTIPGGLTLHQLSRAADVVAVARVTRADAEARGAELVPKVEAEILELLREGDAKKGKIVFEPHRHADENYVVGEEVLLFLTHKRSAATNALPTYETVEAVADRIVLSPAAKTKWVEATRTYVALGQGPRASADPAALGRVTLSALASDEPRLAGLALRDLTLAGNLALFTDADVPGLVAMVDDGARPISFRVGLLVELERRKLVEVGPRWVALLRAATPEERVVVIRAAASRAFVPAVTAELVGWLEKGKGEVAIAAARALGAPNNVAAVPALIRVMDGEPAELRFVSLGSLRRIGSSEARAAIARAASSHSDPETRRVAATEQNLLGPAPVASTPVEAPASVVVAPEPSRPATWIVLGLAFVVGAGALVVSARKRKKAE